MVCLMDCWWLTPPSNLSAAAAKLKPALQSQNLVNGLSADCSSTYLPAKGLGMMSRHNNKCTVL